jgi:hypothetical protein
VRAGTATGRGGRTARPRSRPAPARRPAACGRGLGTQREDVIQALACYRGFVRVADKIREPIKSAINGAIRRGLLGYSGSVTWREA